MEILHFLLGPIVGCIIGAFTNFIAIKMLFRPLKPVKIGKYTLPFTPGVIPKRQKVLADALADTVYNNFFTNNDIEGIFMSEEMAEVFSEGILKSLIVTDSEEQQEKMKKIVDVVGEDEYNRLVLNTQAAIYNRLHMAILSTDVASMVSSASEQVIREKTQGGFFTDRFANDSRAQNLANYIGKSVDDYIKEHDVEIIAPMLQKAFSFNSDVITEMRLSPDELFTDLDLKHETLLALVKGGYVDFMKNNKEKIARTFHMREFIHDRIMELDPADIERLVNQAIKKEMNYLVYLGGFLGLIIGLVNSFF